MDWPIGPGSGFGESGERRPYALWPGIDITMDTPPPGTPGTSPDVQTQRTPVTNTGQWPVNVPPGTVWSVANPTMEQATMTVPSRPLQMDTSQLSALRSTPTSTAMGNPGGVDVGPRLIDLSTRSHAPFEILANMMRDSSDNVQRGGVPLSPQGSDDLRPRVRGRTTPAAPRRRYRRRGQHAPDGDRPPTPPVVPLEHAENLQDETLVAEVKASLSSRYQLDVDVAGRSTALVRRAKGDLISDIRLTEGHRSAAEDSEQRLRSIAADLRAALRAEYQDSGTEEEVNECLTLAIGGVTRAANVYTRVSADHSLTLKERWTALQLLQQAAGRGSGTAPPACGVCCVQPIAQVALPCGHVFCRECIEKMTSIPRSKCWMCRERVEDITPIFFP